MTNPPLAKKLLLAILFPIFLCVLSGCAGFLDDYSYRPMGVSQPANSY